MNKKILLLISLVFIFGCAQAEQPRLIDDNVTWLRDLDVAGEIAKNQDKPILIDFYTEWCGWCKRLDKDTYAEKNVGKILEQFVCVKIDAEKNEELTKKYGIRGFPSTVFLRSGGELIEVAPGYMPPDDFINLLEKILSKL